MSKAKQHTSDVLKAVSSKGEEFIAQHPLFGLDGKLPKTAQAIKDAAQHVNDGLVTADEAEQNVTRVLDAELSKNPDLEDEFNEDLMMAVFGQQTVN
jgi:hypothetical protein